MKNKIKWFRGIAFTAMIGFTMLDLGTGMIGYQENTKDKKSKFTMAATTTISCNSGCGGSGDERQHSDSSTKGRLTITGLNDYQGLNFYCGGFYLDNDDILCLTDVNRIEDDRLGPGGGGAIVIVDGDSVTLYVWRYYHDFLSLKSYTGNHKNLTAICSIFSDEETWGTPEHIYITGTVTVSFSNGKATGAFVPDE
jgi:hypothetical protein